MILEFDQFTQRVDALRSQLKEVGDGLHIEDMEREACTSRTWSGSSPSCTRK